MPGMLSSHRPWDPSSSSAISASRYFTWASMNSICSTIMRTSRARASAEKETPTESRAASMTASALGRPQRPREAPSMRRASRVTPTCFTWAGVAQRFSTARDVGPNGSENSSAYSGNTRSSTAVVLFFSMVHCPTRPRR